MSAEPGGAGGRSPGLPIWSELAPTAPPTGPLQESLETEVCVVGLGGSGLAALGELAHRGVAAVGVDRGELAAGAAGRNGGFLLAGLAGFHHLMAERLGAEWASVCYRATQSALREMAEETPDSIHIGGSLRIAVDADELADCRRQLESMRADGLAVEQWSGPEGDGLLFPEDAALQPVARCRELARRCLDAGLRLFTGTEVLQVGPGLVICAGAEVRCRAALVCVDGGLDRVVPEMEGVVRSARLQMLATAPIVHRVTDRPVYRRFGYDYYQQLAGGQLLIGGGRDRGGEAEWTDISTPSPRVQRELDGLVTELAGTAATVTHRWSGVVGYTRSGLPVVRQVGPGVFVAGGYSGTGNVIGRIAGRALVELALDGSSEDAQLFDGPDGH